MESAEPAYPGDPNLCRQAAATAPLDNCSSQPFLISGEISRVPAQRDAHRDKSCGSSSQCPCTGRGQGRGAAGVTLPLALPPLSSALLFPLLMTLKLAFPLHPWQRWAVLWGPGGRGAGAAPGAGLAAGPAAARSLCPPGTEGIPVLSSSSAAAAWGSTRPAGRPKVTRAACCPAASPGAPARGGFSHPRAPHGCSSARGSQDTPQSLQPGLQRPLAKSWAAAAGGALWVCVESGPSVTPSPRPGPLLHPPVLMAPLHPPDPGPFCFPQPLLFSLSQTMALCMPHRTIILPTLQTRIPLNSRPFCTPPEPLPFSPLQPRALCHPPSPHHLYSPILQNTTTTCPTFRPPFSLFSPPILPPPQLLRLFPPDAGGSPVPRASLEPPAAPGQAGVCGMLGQSVPPPSPLHWTRPARSQVGAHLWHPHHGISPSLQGILLLYSNYNICIQSYNYV